MFSLFGTTPNKLSDYDLFVMWMNDSHPIRQVPVRFQFSQSEELDCIGKQILQLKVPVSSIYVLNK